MVEEKSKFVDFSIYNVYIIHFFNDAAYEKILTVTLDF